MNQNLSLSRPPHFRNIPKNGEENGSRGGVPPFPDLPALSYLSADKLRIMSEFVL